MIGQEDNTVLKCFSYGIVDKYFMKTPISKTFNYLHYLHVKNITAGAGCINTLTAVSGNYFFIQPIYITAWFLTAKIVAKK